MAMDHLLARRKMVDCQIRTSDVTNLELLDAFLAVPREAFVPQNLAAIACLDEDLPLGSGRFLLAPAPLAKILQAASIQPGDTVLDIGCATGYSTAIVARLCQQVTGLEADKALAQIAGSAMTGQGIANAEIVNGPHEAGHMANAPYDVIIIGGSVGEIPQALFAQLREDGRLIAVEGTGNSATARLCVKHDGKIAGRRLFNCSIPPLPGFQPKPQFVF